MKAKFNVLVERDEDGYYVATVPSLPGCHTQAKSLDDLIERAKEAIELYLEVEKEIAPGAPLAAAAAGGVIAPPPPSPEFFEILLRYQIRIWKAQMVNA
jgi:predicted RNase H-like HicB family nuclease